MYALSGILGQLAIIAIVANSTSKATASQETDHDNEPHSLTTLKSWWWG